AGRNRPAPNLPGQVFTGANATSFAQRSRSTCVWRFGESARHAGIGNEEIIGERFGSDREAVGSNRRRFEMTPLTSAISRALIHFVWQGSIIGISLWFVLVVLKK